jgi:hypothetical protein
METTKQKGKQMASRGKAISVKIATTKVIKALESALAKLEKDYSTQEANEAKFKKAQEKHNKEVAKLALAHIAKATELSANTRWNGTINVDFNLPAGTITIPDEPKRDFVTLGRYEYDQQKEEISNAIRILKMTDEEVVSTSTYQAVARYL